MSRRNATVNIHPQLNLQLRFMQITAASPITMSVQRLLRSLVVILAAGVIVIGVAMTLRALLAPEVTAQLGDTLAVGGLHMTVASASWVAEHKHTDDTNEISLAPVQPDGRALDMSDGYAMPAAMMPGMPEKGLRRLRMVVTLANMSNHSQSVSITDFALVANHGERWQPLAQSNFRHQQLAPGQAIEGVLFVDIPADTPGLSVYWTRQAGVVRLPLGAAPGHDADHR